MAKSDLVEMVALRDFRLRDENGSRTLRKADLYWIHKLRVPFHINTGRGERVKRKSTKVK